MSLKKDTDNVHGKSYKVLYSNKELFLDLVKEILGKIDIDIDIIIVDITPV